jgi:hypothetical protein
MTRRDRFAARMRRLAAAPITPSATFTIVLALSPFAAGDIDLERLDALQLEGKLPTLQIAPARAEFYLIEISGLAARII